MDQSEKKQFNEEMRERTIAMAVNVRNALMSIEVKAIDRSIVNQLIRSSSSVAANYRSATRGRSDAEFYSKMCIVVEESDETLFWIDYFIRIKVLKEEDCQKLRNEIDQLVRLFASIRRKMKEKIDNSHQV